MNCMAHIFAARWDARPWRQALEHDGSHIGLIAVPALLLCSLSVWTNSEDDSLQLQLQASSMWLSVSEIGVNSMPAFVASIGSPVILAFKEVMQLIASTGFGLKVTCRC